MKINKLNSEDVIETINKHRWLKYLLYAGGAVIGVWLVSETSKLLTINPLLSGESAIYCRVSIRKTND